MKLLVPCALMLLASPTAVGVDRFDPVRDVIRAQLMKRHAPSLTVAVSQGNRIVWEEGFGWANRERMTPANANTMYSLASISKPMTATALMTLVNAGKIDLDKPINEYLGSAKLRARIGDAREATVRRVANHSSGLPEHYQFFYANEPWRPPSPDETILRYGNLLAPPGERYRYSNLGYGILSTVIARISGRTFADYMREAVFLKLGMTRTSATVDPALADVQAIRYGVDGLPIPLYTTDHDGASAIYSSAHDMVRFGMWHLKLHLADQVAILPDSLIDAMHQPTMDEGDGDGYGVGWETTSLSGYRALVHTGGMPGVATLLRIIPSEKIVIVVLCNAEDDDLVSMIADEIARVLLPKWRAPAVTAAESIGVFAPPHELVGVWKGVVATPDSEMSLTLTIPSSGDVHVKLGSQLETVLSRARFTSEGLLRGSMSGSLGITDAARRPYFLGLTLKLRNGNVLNGSITARANDSGVMPTNGLYPSVAGQPAPDRVQANAFILAQWAELTKQ